MSSKKFQPDHLPMCFSTWPDGTFKTVNNVFNWREINWLGQISRPKKRGPRATRIKSKTEQMLSALEVRA